MSERGGMNMNDDPMSPETIEEIAQIVKRAFEEAGNMAELDALCDFALSLPPPPKIFRNSMSSLKNKAS